MINPKHKLVHLLLHFDPHNNNLHLWKLTTCLWKLLLC